MKFLSFTRHSEWWEPKIIPLLSVGYLVICLNGYSWAASIGRLLFLILSIIIGAVYVSIINDASDIKEDRAAGKKNRMEKLAGWQIALIIVSCGCIGVYCGYRIYPDTRSLLFYILSWIVFSLYSFYPFRLKERGIWGVLADSTGAHLFPTLLIACNLVYFSGDTPSLSWTILTGIWAFSFGLRGILWHQFYDRENDTVARINTFASRIEPDRFRFRESLIFTVEIICFSLMIYEIANIWLLLSVLFYILLVIIRKKALNITTIIILTSKDQPFRIILHDFYLLFFPLAILVSIAIHQPYGWILLCVHFLLFPRPVYDVARDLLNAYRNLS